MLRRPGRCWPSSSPAVFFLLLYAQPVRSPTASRPSSAPPGPRRTCSSATTTSSTGGPGSCGPASPCVFALIVGVGASSQWNEWILFTQQRVDSARRIRCSTPTSAFYVFRLPFLTFVVNWLFASLIIILIVTAVAHYLNGGIRVQAAFQRVTPQVKAHLSVILGLLALVKAADYWLDRYELTFSTRGTVDGATYTEVNAQLPAIYLLLSISLLAFVLFIINIWRRGWVLPAVGRRAVGVRRHRGRHALPGVRPALPGRAGRVVQGSALHRAQHRGHARRVRPRQRRDQAVRLPRRSSSAAAAPRQPGHHPATSACSTPTSCADTYQRLQGERGFYRFHDLDVDRYTVDINEQEITSQVVLGARELDPGGIPQQSWEGQHLAFTHGYGVALAPANVVTVDRPARLPHRRRPHHRRRGAARPPTRRPARSCTSARASRATPSSAPSATRSTTPTRTATRSPTSPTTATAASGERHGLAVRAPGRVRPALRRDRPARSPTSSPTSRASSTCATCASGSPRWRRSSRSTPTRTRSSPRTAAWSR